MSSLPIRRTGLSGQIALVARPLSASDVGSGVHAGRRRTAAQRFVMRQTRRMRSNERHYIDHPKFGVIALITPSAPSDDDE